MGWWQTLAAIATLSILNILSRNHPEIKLGLGVVGAAALVAWVGILGLRALGRWNATRSGRLPALAAETRGLEENIPESPLPPVPVNPPESATGGAMPPATAQASTRTLAAAVIAPDVPPSPALSLPVEYPPPAVAEAVSSPLLLGARLCWVLFWVVLALPFAWQAATRLTGSWETISTAPGDILGGGLEDISAHSPYFGLVLMALALGFIVCRVKSKPAVGGTLLRARLALLLVAGIGAAVSVRQIAFIADDVFRRGGVEIPEDDSIYRNTMLGQLARATFLTNFDAEITAELAMGNVERARVLLAAADELGRSVSPVVRASYEEKGAFWSFDSLERNGTRCFDGGIRRKVETITHIACMVAVDFVPVPWVGVSAGDLLDLGFQFGNNYFNHEEVDQTIVGLAVAGIAVDLLFPADDDIQHLQPAMSAVKAGIRASKRLKMAPRVETGLRRLAANVIDADSIRHISAFHFKDTAKHAFHPEGFAAFRPVLDDLYSMYRHTGYAATPVLALKHADDLSELTHFRRMSRVFGKNTDGVIELLGKAWKRGFWKAGKAGAKATAELAVWYSGLAASVTAFLIALSTSASAWLMKRLVLLWARREATPPA